MNQGARNRTLTRLRSGAIRVLVATDVAARGIDVAGISHVINFDLPKFAEDYVHRIGRTGRAGSQGIAVSFASGKDVMNLKKIERFTGHAITPHVVPGFEAKRPMRSGAPSPAGKRPGFGNNDRRGGYEGRPNGNREGYAGRGGPNKGTGTGRPISRGR
jgi:superfamily II DNA/RNA helicase